MMFKLFELFSLTQTGIPKYVTDSKMVSSILTIVGAFLLWFSLFLVGIIAQRYEKVCIKKLIGSS